MASNWILVPAEPTPEMEVAGVVDALCQDCASLCDYCTSRARGTYRAMLDARPEAPDWEAMADELAALVDCRPDSAAALLARYRTMKGK